MTKKITLNHLINYVHERYSKDDREEYCVDNTLNLEEHKFKPVEYGKKSVLKDLPETVEKLFYPYLGQLERHGQNTSPNRTLFSSFAFCLSEKISVEELKDNLYSEIDEMFTTFNYKQLGWTKKEVQQTVQECKNNRIAIRLLTDYFNINTFVISVQEGSVSAVYPEDNFNMYKMNIFLIFNNDVFEPVTYSGSKLWDYKMEPFKKLVVVDKMCIKIMNVDFTKHSEQKLFKVDNSDLSLHQTVDEPNMFEEGSCSSENNEEIELDTDTDITTTKGVFVKKKCSSSSEYESDSNNIQTLKKFVSIKMPVADIRKIAEKCGVDTVDGVYKSGKNKMKTKAQLIKEIQEI